MKVSVKPLANVTEGFANDVDDVNQYPAVIYKPTDGATIALEKYLLPKIVIIRPNVAINSLK